MKNELLRIEALNKRLGHDYLKHINFNLFEKEILGIITRSDAQRDALFDILTGEKRPDSGRLFLFDRPTELFSKKHAKRCGIYGVSRQSALVFNMSVAENIFIDKNHISNLHIVNRKLMLNEAEDILRKTGVGEICPNTLVKRLTPAMRCMIEILKASLDNVKILIIDDVLHRFTEREVTAIKELLLRASAKGVSIIFLANRVNKLFDIADRAAVICDGMTVDILDKEQLRLDTILPMLSGNPILPRPNKQKPDLLSGELLLKVEKPIPNNTDFSISLFKGEVLGIYDQEWQYSAKLSNMLGGKIKCSCPISLRNRRIRLGSAHRAIKNGICIINDRNIKTGLLYRSSLVENVTLSCIRHACCPFGIIRKRRANDMCFSALKALESEELMTRFSGKTLPMTMSKNTKMHILSARWLCTNPNVMIFVNQHIDFDDLTIDSFKSIIENLRKHGVSIIIFSMSMSELTQTCDRIIEFPQ